MFIDVSQQESAVSLIGGEVLAYQVSGQEPERIGNHSHYFAPHNAYQCSGEDRWVTISVSNDAQWRSLAEAISGPELAAEQDFATGADRLQRQDRLDRLISDWTSDKDPYQISHLLQQVGVPASPVMRGPDLLEDPHYKARGTFVEVDHEQVGPKMYPGIPFKMSATPGEVRWAAPALGQHNRLVYGEVLGMTGDEIDRLEERGVIGTKPTGSRII
jgi:benzylsuccinate CoA-transferase BbsF subunit